MNGCTITELYIASLCNEAGGVVCVFVKLTSVEMHVCYSDALSAITGNM